MMVSQWEQDVYDRILNAYEQTMGLDLHEDPFVYHEIVRLMEYMKGEYGTDINKLKEVISNALVLLISLFFRKDKDDFDPGRPLTPVEQKTLKSLLTDVYQAATNSSAA